MRTTDVADAAETGTKAMTSKIRHLVKSTRDVPQLVVSSVLEDCDQAVAPKLPQVQSMKRIIRYITQQSLAGPALPLISGEIVFSPELTKTFKGDQIVIYDSGPIEKRIVIFATRRNLRWHEFETEVRCLSRENTAMRLFVFRKELLQFFQTKDHKFQKILEDKNFILQLAYLSDIFGVINTSIVIFRGLRATSLISQPN